MKKLLVPISLVLASSKALADMGMMEGYGMMGGAGMFGWGLLWLVWLVLGAFLFSAIFWLTYNWLVKDKKKKR